MWKSIGSFFSTLVEDDNKKSSARFASLVALLVSSFVLLFSTFKHETILFEMFSAYLAAFVVQYGASKYLSGLNRKKKGKEETDAAE